jgi:predicted metal-dependent phosphoesterase TrpH
MGLADLHIHTSCSWDGTATPQAVVRHAALRTDLDIIAITDHDTLQGVPEAVESGYELGIEVIPGCEITTAEGHLLAYFIHTPVPAGLSLVETVMRVGEQEGLCIVPHPLAINARGLNSRSLKIALRDPDVPRILVALETYNAGLIYRSSNEAARVLAENMGFGRVGSSDSHLLWTIGAGQTAFIGSTANELRCALQSHAVVPVRRAIFHRRRLIAGWIGRYSLRRFGLSAS